MHAHANKRDTDEIVADIIKLVKNPSIEIFVRKLMDDLCVACPPFTGNRKKNLEYVKELGGQIDELKKTLRQAPNPLCAVLFAPERFWSVWVPQSTSTEIDPKVRDYLAREPERLTRLVEELDRIRAECDRVILLKLGKHGAVRYQQERAAIASREVMRYCGLSLARSRSSTYCKVAGLFFEAATGEYDRDLLRACEALARDPLRAQKR
jgi:hypothetical protein